MRRLLTAVLLFTTPIAAFASDAPNSPPPEGQQAEGRWGPRGDQDRAARLVQRLGLSEAQATEVKATFETFKARQKPIHEQLRAANQLLRRAADGDPSVQGQVDGAIRQLIDARTQLFQARQELFAAIAPKLTPEQKAKFVLMAERGGHGQMGRHPRR